MKVLIILIFVIFLLNGCKKEEINNCTEKCGIIVGVFPKDGEPNKWERKNIQVINFCSGNSTMSQQDLSYNESNIGDTLCISKTW